MNLYLNIFLNISSFEYFYFRKAAYTRYNRFSEVKTDFLILCNMYTVVYSSLVNYSSQGNVLLSKMKIVSCRNHSQVAHEGMYSVHKYTDKLMECSVALTL